MNEVREIRLRKTLRGIVLVIAGLTAAAIVIGMLPGHALYIDGELVERTAAGSDGFSQFACWLIAPGLVLWLHPRITIALGWSVLTWIGTLMLVFTRTSHETVGHVMVLWPAKAVFYLMTPVVFTLLLGLPFGVAIYEAVIRKSEARAVALANPGLPAARVVNPRPRA